MGILADMTPQPSGPLNNSPFPDDSLLSRIARGGFTPTEADLEELQRLAQNGNRAERRAAAKHLKKHGIAALPAAPRAPVVIHVAAPTVLGEGGPAEPPAPMRAQAMTQRPAMKEPAKQAQAPKQSASAKAAQGKGKAKQAATKEPSPRKMSTKKAAAKKVAAKKAAPVKRAPVKAATKKAAPKKTAVKKPAAKKAAPKKSRRK